MKEDKNNFIAKDDVKKIVGKIIERLENIPMSCLTKNGNHFINSEIQDLKFIIKQIEEA